MTYSAALRRVEQQERFRARILEEWRRAERSSRPALLVLLDGFDRLPPDDGNWLESTITLFRETDVVGWYTSGQTLGVICLELGKFSVAEAHQILARKIEHELLARVPKLPLELTVHSLPPYSGTGALRGRDADFAEDCCRALMPETRSMAMLKRSLDITGSAALLILLLPALVAIGAAIRSTSRGPALYRQMRTGQFGRPFGLYKFRTMVPNSDDRLHREYVQRFIQGSAEKCVDGSGKEMYKLTHDPRITPLGRFLRRSSLDELPQLWNVLRGDMSLVGPRPPLPFEVACYEIWHRRRVFELKPGLTGLWQVRGRSRCSFDEMIRLDLQHGKAHSLGLYLRVLLETPRAVLSGGGAQ